MVFAAHPRFLCRQFENEANAKFHYDTTGQERANTMILRTFDIINVGREGATIVYINFIVIYSNRFI